MKKQFGLLFLMCIISMILALPAMAADIDTSGTCGDNLTWTLDTEGVLTISGTGDMTNYGEPSDGLNYAPWYENRGKINKIEIKNGVTSIGNLSFFGCDNLNSVNLPLGITNIGYRAFYECVNLTTIAIPNSVTTIGSGAFLYCQRLSTIHIPSSVTSLDGYAFYGCSELKSAYFEGDLPELFPESVFIDVANDFTIYWNEGALNWTFSTWKNSKDIYYRVVMLPRIYTVSLTVDSAQTTVNEQITVTVEADKAFNASEFTLTYNSNLLAFNADQTNLGNVEKAEQGTLHIADYGVSKTAYTLVFDAKSTGTADITLINAAFGTEANADTEDLTAAEIQNGTVSITINPADHAVSFPQDILSGNPTVTNGQDYTFKITNNGKYYNYTVSATIYGVSVDVTADGNGNYTVPNVTGPLVIQATRTPKTFTLDFQSSSDAILPDNMQNSMTVTYGQIVSFPLSTEEYDSISIQSAYYVSGDATVPYSIKDGIVTIDGNAIIGNMVFVIEQVRTNVTVVVEGNAASDALGYASAAKVGQAYTLTVTQDSKYTYTVSAFIDGQTVTLQVTNHTYTIPAEYITVNSTRIVFTVSKTLKLDAMSVTEYLTLNQGSKLWLILVPGEKISNMVYCYNETFMFWSDRYEAYCILVESQDSPTITASNLTLITGTAVDVNYAMDVNMSSKIDANDAQLVYNMYNAMYAGITDDVTVEKYLRADINGNKSVTTEDAAAIINYILTNK